MFTPYQRLHRLLRVLDNPFLIHRRPPFRRIRAHRNQFCHPLVIYRLEIQALDTPTRNLPLQGCRASISQMHMRLFQPIVSAPQVINHILQSWTDDQPCASLKLQGATLALKIVNHTRTHMLVTLARLHLHYNHTNTN